MLAPGSGKAPIEQIQGGVEPSDVIAVPQFRRTPDRLAGGSAFAGSHGPFRGRQSPIALPFDQETERQVGPAAPARRASVIDRTADGASERHRLQTSSR